MRASCTVPCGVCGDLHDSRVAAHDGSVGIGMAHAAGTMHDASFDDTLLVPRLPPADPPRSLAATFAPVRASHWPWLLLAVLVILGLGTPLASRDDLARAAQGKALLEQLGR